MEEDELIENDWEKEERGRNRKGVAIFIGTIELLVAIAGSVVLGITQDDCSQPVRLWIFVMVGIFGFHSMFLLSTEGFSGNLREKSGATSMYMAINTIIQCFLFLWMLLGAVWTFNDSECYDDFTYGWMLAVVSLSIYFGIISLLLAGLCCVTCITCVGSWHISAYLMKEQ